MYQSVPTDCNPPKAAESRSEFVRASFDIGYIQRLQQRDPETERHFVNYFGKLLRIKLHYRVRNTQMVEDLIQDTFVRVLTALRRTGGIQSPEALGGFVNSVCNNLLCEQHRRRTKTEYVSIDEFDPPDRQDSAESRLMSEENRALVRRTLEELPGKDRDLLRMVFYENKERGEICGTFHVTPEYLRVLVHLAKAKFREYWMEGNNGNFTCTGSAGGNV